MQSHAGSCSPETLVRLQKVFDAVWLELKARRSPHTFPWATEATRYTIANLVFRHVNEADRDAELIKRQVLQRFISGE
jgi:hypothetical protein